nr:hypothetical protein [Yersinia ruckeri]
MNPISAKLKVSDIIVFTSLLNLIFDSTTLNVTQASKIDNITAMNLVNPEGTPPLTILRKDSVSIPLKRTIHFLSVTIGVGTPRLFLATACATLPAAAISEKLFPAFNINAATA